MKPAVSVIMIFLNGEEFIVEAIESVLAQSYASWELLLVDDGSSDGSSAIALDYARRFDGQIRYLEHPGHVNKGMGATRILGMENAAGDYIAFLDADDLWLPKKLEEQIAIMEAHPEAAMIYGRTQIWHSWTGAMEDADRDYFLDLGVDADRLVSPPELLLPMIQNRAQSPTSCNALLRKEVFAQIGGFGARFRGMFEDVAVFAHVAMIYPVYVSSVYWARYRQHPKSTCSQAEQNGKAFQDRLHWLELVENLLRSRQITDPGIWKALRIELWPYRHPFLTKCTRRAERIAAKVNRGRRKLVRLFQGGPPDPQPNEPPRS